MLDAITLKLRVVACLARLMAFILGHHNLPRVVQAFSTEAISVTKRFCIIDSLNLKYL
jgi:hypothetical protein